MLLRYLPISTTTYRALDLRTFPADRHVGGSADWQINKWRRAWLGVVVAFRDLAVWAVWRVPEYAHHARASASGSLPVAEAVLPRLILLGLQ